MLRAGRPVGGGVKRKYHTPKLALVTWREADPRVRLSLKADEYPMPGERKMKDPYAMVIDCLTLYDGFAQRAFDHNRLKISVSSTASAAKNPVLNPQRISDGEFQECADLPTGTYVAFCITAEATQIIGEALIVRLVSTSR